MKLPLIFFLLIHLHALGTSQDQGVVKVDLSSNSSGQIIDLFIGVDNKIQLKPSNPAADIQLISPSKWIDIEKLSFDLFNISCSKENTTDSILVLADGQVVNCLLVQAHKIECSFLAETEGGLFLKEGAYELSVLKKIRRFTITCSSKERVAVSVKSFVFNLLNKNMEIQ